MKFPDPLTPDEQERLWRWEKRSVRFHTAAIPLLLAACFAVFYFNEATWLRRLMLVLVIALVGAATVLQLSEKCPRCRARLRIKTLMLLPDRCHYCGVGFERPPA
jgi:hypothetical protein